MTTNSTEKEIPFATGESNTSVVRIGNTVRRHRGPNSERVHSVMNFLTSKGFTLTPKYLGVDEKEREIISYIAGELVSKGEENMDLAIQSIKELRKFHDILSKSDLRELEETVCHRDFAPWNVLTLKGKVVGIIDFDDAYPGKRITDVAYSCWTFLNLGNTKSKLTAQEQIERIVILIEAYGHLDTRNFVKELLSEQSRILKYRKSRIKQVRNNKEVIVRKRKYEEIKKQMEWVETNRSQINSALLEIDQ